MLDDIAAGRVPRGESIVFLHTGGNPALFAYADEVIEDPASGESCSAGRHARQ